MERDVADEWGMAIGIWAGLLWGLLLMKILEWL
jgi:thiamine transporter ThiT